jgi:hypothetical protein
MEPISHPTKEPTVHAEQAFKWIIRILRDGAVLRETWQVGGDEESVRSYATALLDVYVEQGARVDGALAVSVRDYACEVYQRVVMITRDTSIDALRPYEAAR